MVIEFGSRLLAIVVTVAFTLDLTREEIPMLPRGRWTVVALFALGFGMCMLAGMRDGIGTSEVAPLWLKALNATLGTIAIGVVIAVLIGFSWRLGAALLAAAVAASWVSSLAFAVSAGSPSAGTGIVTLLVGIAFVAVIVRQPIAHRPLWAMR
jgi:hypothetical protein